MGGVNRAEISPRNDNPEAYFSFCYDSDVGLPEYVITSLLKSGLQHLSHLGKILTIL